MGREAAQPSLDFSRLLKHTDSSFSSQVTGVLSAGLIKFRELIHPQRSFWMDSKKEKANLISQTGLYLRRLEGVSARLLRAGAFCRNPERSLAKDLFLAQRKRLPTFLL